MGLAEAALQAVAQRAADAKVDVDLLAETHGVEQLPGTFHGLLLALPHVSAPERCQVSMRPPTGKSRVGGLRGCSCSEGRLIYMYALDRYAWQCATWHVTHQVGPAKQ